MEISPQRGRALKCLYLLEVKYPNLPTSVSFYHTRVIDALRRQEKLTKRLSNSQYGPTFTLYKVDLSYSPIGPCGKTHKQGWGCGMIEGHPGRCAPVDVDLD